MEELKLERISDEDQFNCSLTNEHPYEELRDTILEVCNAQLQADQQVVDKLKAEIAQLKETIKSYHDTYVKGGNTGFKL